MQNYTLLIGAKHLTMFVYLTIIITFAIIKIKIKDMGLFDFLGKKKETNNTLFYDTEVHCHILPGIDDGSRDVATSVELVKQMKSWGIRRIVTTSHVTESTFENTPETITTAYNQLRSALDNEGIEIEIHTSAEYRMDEYFLNLVKSGTLLPFPENYILIENSFFQPFWEIRELIFKLQLKGYSPILAHPERYKYYHSTPQIYKELHDQGCLFQVNLLSLSGYYYPEVKDMAWHLLNQGMVDFIGSDIHHLRHAEHITQYLASKEYNKLKEKAGNILNNKLQF